MTLPETEHATDVVELEHLPILYKQLGSEAFLGNGHPAEGAHVFGHYLDGSKLTVSAADANKEEAESRYETRKEPMSLRFCQG